MLEQYIIGMILAFVSGMLHAFGAILQKNVVNKIPVEQRDEQFMRRLLRSPAWLGGFALSMGLGTVTTLESQRLIGPALNPGLTSAGLMITLTLGAAALLGERLRRREILGIFLMIGGAFCLGYSNLDIPSREVSLLDRGLLLRIGVFSLGLGLCWLLALNLARRGQGVGRGLGLAISGGFLYGLSNLWVLPLIVTIGLVFDGAAQTIEIVIFALASIMLVATNIGGIRIVQEAYKFAPASLAQPILQIPTQTIPILIYFFVFQRTASGAAWLLIPLGVGLVIGSGYLLGQREA